MPISFNAAALLNGSGIDVNSLVNQIQAQQSGQLTVWQQQQTDLQTKASALNIINTDLNNLVTAVNAIKDPLGALTAVSASSSMPAILTATAQTTAAAGNHTIVVSTLASAGTVYTDAVAGGANVSILTSPATTGSLSLQIGGSGGVTKDIQITAGSNDTLTTLASYINTQSTQNNWGVKATVLNDASGARLAIYSQATGTPGALAITSNSTSLVFEPPVGGINAGFTVDGIPFNSTTNTVTDAIQGVTLNLVSAEPTVPLQLAVGPDTTQATNAINAFVVAYNTLVTAINHQYAVDPTTNNEGPLGSDASLRSLQSSLLADVTAKVTGNSGGLVNLASLGINMNNDGTLTVGNTVDNKSLSDVLSANPSAFLDFFQNASTGFAHNFSTDLTNLTSSVDGVLNLDIAQNSTEQANLTDEISAFQSRMASQKLQLIAQFSRVNAALEQYPYTLAMINAALGYAPPTVSSNTSPTTGTSTSSSSSSNSSTSGG